MFCCALLLPFALPEASGQNLLWENQGLTDEASVPSGSTFQYNNATVTVTWSVTTDGGFATYPGGAGSTGGGNDYVTYEASQEGAHTGLLLLAFDNAAYDKDDYITLTVSFSTPQYGLAFSLLDLDSDGWDDMVEMFYNGSNNVAANTSLWDYAASNRNRTVEGDDEPSFTGWEGRDGRRADPAQNYGNVDIDFTGIGISNFTITFGSTDDYSGDPGGQKIGFSDFTNTLIPEPATGLGGLMLGLFALLQTFGRSESRRRSRGLPSPRAIS